MTGGRKQRANSRERLAILRRVGESTQRPDDRGTTIPSWRRIEMLRERRALMKALEDPLEEHIEPDEAIFLSDSEQASRFYTSGLFEMEQEISEPDEDDADLD